MFRWQYQSHAEPVSQDAESVTVDRWLPSDPVVVRPARFVAAVIAASLFFVPPVAVAEVVTLDKWNSPTQVPQAEVEVQYLSPSVFQDLAFEDATLDKWFHALSEPVRTPSRSPVFDPFTIDPLLLTQGETIPVDKWFFQDPIAPLERVDQYQYPSFFWNTETPGVEIVTLDKWYQRPSEPVRVAPRTAYFDPFIIDPLLLTQGEDVLVDKWFVELARPTLPQFTGYYYPTTDFRVDLEVAEVLVKEIFCGVSPVVRLVTHTAPVVRTVTSTAPTVRLITNKVETT